MLRRLYILAIIVTILYAVRVFTKVTAPRVPASKPAASAPVVNDAPSTPEPRRDTASARPPTPVASESKAQAPSMRTDVAPEALLERKRHGKDGARGTDDPAAPPLARYAKFKQTERRSVGPRKFIILGARAVRPEEYHSDLGPVIFEENEHRIVADSGRGWDQLATAKDSLPLMLNPSNGRLAFVTGAIQATVVDAATAEHVARLENLSLVHYDRAIGLAYFKAPDGYALRPGLARIQAVPGVRGVELEVVESRKVAR